MCARPLSPSSPSPSSSFHSDCRRTMCHTLAHNFFIYILIMKCKQMSVFGSFSPSCGFGAMRANTQRSGYSSFVCVCVLCTELQDDNHHRLHFPIWSVHSALSTEHREWFQFAGGYPHSIFDDKLFYGIFTDGASCRHSCRYRVGRIESSSDEWRASEKERKKRLILPSVGSRIAPGNGRTWNGAQKINFHDDKLHKYVNKL